MFTLWKIQIIIKGGSMFDFVKDTLHVVTCGMTPDSDGDSIFGSTKKQNKAYQSSGSSSRSSAKTYLVTQAELNEMIGDIKGLEKVFKDKIQEFVDRNEELYKENVELKAKLEVYEKIYDSKDKESK